MTHLPDPSICDPACQKTIINSGFMAVLAPHLADMLGVKHPLYVEVVGLGVAAQAATDLYDCATGFDLLTLTEIDPATWEGCEHARTIVKWMESGGTEADMKDKIGAWRKDIFADMGKFLEGHKSKGRKVEQHDEASR